MATAWDWRLHGWLLGSPFAGSPSGLREIAQAPLGLVGIAPAILRSPTSAPVRGCDWRLLRRRRAAAARSPEWLRHSGTFAVALTSITIYGAGLYALISPLTAGRPGRGSAAPACARAIPIRRATERVYQVDGFVRGQWRLIAQPSAHIRRLDWCAYNGDCRCALRVFPKIRLPIAIVYPGLAASVL